MAPENTDSAAILPYIPNVIADWYRSNKTEEVHSISELNGILACIDASGFTQMVYRINGYKLLRSSEEQATQGTALSFIEECEAGDLAFFDNNEGIIDHVGIIMDNNYIIHVHGKVRIDRIDHTGIFNNDVKNYTHQLRVIKKII